jgi:hypothetical protein
MTMFVNNLIPYVFILLGDNLSILCNYSPKANIKHYVQHLHNKVGRLKKQRL